MRRAGLPRLSYGGAAGGAGGEVLSDCSLGYRAKYVRAAAQLAASDALDLHTIGGLPDDALLEALLLVPGVGEKVANCVMLFGYHRLSLFQGTYGSIALSSGSMAAYFRWRAYPEYGGRAAAVYFLLCEKRGICRGEP